jgi:DNA-binding Lrp family transcriptional regulator
MIKINQDLLTRKITVKINKILNISKSYKTSKIIMDFIKSLPKEKNTNFIPINIPIMETKLGIDEKTIRRHLKKLDKTGYIKKHKGKSNSLKIEILKELKVRELTSSQKISLFEGIEDYIRCFNLTIVNEELE